MKHKSQSGSAHVIIIVVLIVIILGLLGFVFWQQLNKASTQANTGSSASTAKSDTSQTSPDSSFKTYADTTRKFSFQYPNDWTIGDSTCFASCGENIAFTVRAPGFSSNGDGGTQGAFISVNPEGISGTLSQTRKDAESLSQGNSYTYNYDFTDVTVASEPGYEYKSADNAHSTTNDSITLAFQDKTGKVWVVGASGDSNKTTSTYNGSKALELLRSSWKWL